MESQDNETSCASSYGSNLTDSCDARQRSEESTAARSVETHPTVSHRSRNSLETNACNRRSSLHLKSEEEEPLHSLSRKSSLSSALKFSRHFANCETDFVEEDNVSYSDTFDSLDSLSESEDEASKVVDRTLSGNRSDSSGDHPNSSGNRSSSSRLLSSYEQKNSPERWSKSSYSGGEDTVFSEEEGARSFSDKSESVSNRERAIRSLSPDVMEENSLSSLGLSSDSSVWSASESISERNTSGHSVEDKFTSADGEIIYYSDFSIEALTARQYTQRSDISEWSLNLKNETTVPASEEFVRKKMRLLRQQSSFHDKVAPPVFSVKSRKTGKDHEGVESVDLKDFCTKKLRHLKNHHTDADPCKVFSSGVANFYKRLEDDADVLTYGIPFSVIQRLRIDRNSMIDFHEPSACDRCRQELGQLGLSEFVQSKMAIVRERLTNLKLNDARNSSTYGMKVLGEILAEASCLSRQPERVMQRLLEPLAVHRTVTGTDVQTV